MQGRKAPGIDGLTVEFYKEYWDILGPDLLLVLNESLASGSLPFFCRSAVVTLLPKKGNLQEIKNLRPVSLLCVDYKILSSRLRGAMEQVIHRDQTYCVPGRSMVDVYLTGDVLELSSSLNSNAGLIQLDQEKTFDRVEHKFLWKVMERFGFNSGFIAMIRVLYNDIESLLKLNGSLCAPFRVHRGVQQGCALSRMLYALSLEPLLSKIRTSLDGLFLPSFNSNIVLSAYADDIIVLIKTQNDVEILTNLTDKYNNLSAAKINWNKSEAVAVGNWPNGLPTLSQNLAWKKEGLKYLGVFLGNKAMEKKNWEGVEDKICGKIKKWKWLLPQMSYRGRVLVLNNQCASLLWHRLSLPGSSHWAFNKDPGKNCEFLLGWITLGATGGVVFTERGGGTGPHPPGQQDGSVQAAVPAEVPSWPNRSGVKRYSQLFLQRGESPGTRYCTVFN